MAGLRALALCLAATAKVTQIAARLSPEEKFFVKIPEASLASEHLKFITSEPHVAGTDGDAKMANYVQQQMLDAGVPAEIFALDVRLNYPTARPSVTMQDPLSGQVTFEASLSEDVVDSDPTSNTWYRNHTFMGYSPSGDVTAEAVYANYGRPSDFDALEAAGVGVQGKVVLVRYGECFRGLKVMNAERRGAVAVLIYSDPADDGYGQGPVYPEGAWRPESGVQRGSVQYLSLCAGDPFRVDKRYMGVDSQQLCGYHPNETMPHIPALPLSYGDATPILRALGGPEATGDFVGGIKGLQYTLGPSTQLVRVRTEVEFVDRAIWNVVGTIQGTLPPAQDQPVLVGNHRDAWVFGAADPNSGTAGLLEVARGLGALLATGWRPRRTIKLLSWSGEEYGLLGSTGWAELNAGELKRALAYLNADTLVCGDELAVSATPALSSLWEQVLLDLDQDKALGVSAMNGPIGSIEDANTGRPLYDPPLSPGEIETLGSGSDYTVFLDNMGIASLDFRFGKKAMYGVYHSIYDSYTWMDKWGGDEAVPGSAFTYMAAGARIWGVLAIRLADSVVVPFNHTAQAVAMQGYLAQLEAYNSNVDLAPLYLAVDEYAKAAAAIAAQQEPSASTSNAHVRLPSAFNELNEKLSLTERQFIADQGLPERQWFKHVLQAPGLYLGYAAEPFPGVSQALDDGNLPLAQNQTLLAAERVLAAARYLAP